ncbi:MAG: hypothetical protein BM485_10805 [Desulfobulbaceae bacterium DB1]|nr:MAG: hypothetical protein BM485_10805 [Desulfobulbaceae bacterium DB1]
MTADSPALPMNERHSIKSMFKKAVKGDPRRLHAAIGCFAMLSIGTLPTLFSNPLQYFMGLVYCLIFSAAIAWLIF